MLVRLSINMPVVGVMPDNPFAFLSGGSRQPTLGMFFEGMIDTPDEAFDLGRQIGELNEYIMKGLLSHTTGPEE